MSDKSTKSQRARKAVDRPKKPYPDFPLYPHPLGYWSKKIRGKIHHFGRWGRVVDGKLTAGPYEEGWTEALDHYKAQADDLHAGRTPRVKREGLTIADLANHFLTAKQRQREAGEIGARMFQEYRQTTDLLVSSFGKARLVDDLAADDFESLRATMAERWGPVRLGNAIQKVRTVFKYGFEAGLIERPVRFGGQFKKPSASVMRRHRAQHGERMLEADQLRKLIEAAGVPLQAMILLGVNAGFGNHDVATLPLSALDLDGGWIDYPRPKTGVARRCPLWPETVTALREAIAERPEPRQEEAKDLVFLGARGCSWISLRETNRTDLITVHFTKLLKNLGEHRDGIGFYTLRHVFRTIADAVRDPVAIDLIMGHTDPSMGGHYRERVEDSRLQAVAEQVRAWLFGDPSGNAPKARLDVSDPSDPVEEAESGTQDGEPDSPADERPTLRLYVG